MKRVDKRRETRKDREPGEVRVEFSGKNMTPFGGFGLFRKFIGKLGIEKALNTALGTKFEGDKYPVGRKIMSLVNALICGFDRPSDTEVLKQDKTFQKVMGYSDYPDQSTFSRFLKAFSVKEANRIGEQSVRMLLKVRNNFQGWIKLTLDFDSHVKTVYGNQQRAKVGYNPKKRGRKSYHPLFCFIGESRDFLLGKFRAGNAYTSRGAIEFLKNCLKLIPNKMMQIYVRADSGFFSFDFLSALEKRGIKYAVSAKLYSNIQMKLGGLNYRSLEGGVDVAELEHCMTNGKKTLTCRMIVIREEIREGKPHKKVPRLFDLKGYSYQVIVTNIRQGAPEMIWRFYNGRANVENMIKEAATGFGMDVSPSHCYGGNAAYFQIGMLAYNLMNWFKELALGLNEKKPMIKWVRNHFLLIAGKLVQSSRYVTLKLSQNYPWQREYRQAEARLAALNFI